MTQGGGLVFINDLYFVHEHARRINVWSSFIILSPYLGPLITAFIISKYPWRWAFWLYTLMTGLCLVDIILLCDETYYDRKLEPNQQPKRTSHLYRLLGYEQFKSRHLCQSFFGSIMRPAKVLLKPVVFLAVFYYLLIFAWVVGKL